MSRILVIEKSLTLRHALVRRLRELDFELQSVATYEEGLAHLQDAGESFAAVVFGWPERAISISDELLALLDQPSHRHIAVVVLCESGDTSQLSWITERAGTALLSWDDYRRIGDVLSGIWQGADAAADATTPGDTGDTRGIRILLVDDSPTSRVTYGNLLKHNGYEVEVAGSVDDGFERAIEGAFDIAIIDYFMPGATGDHLCRRLRQDARTRDITQSVLTGTYLDHVIADSLAAGAVECMFKNEANELFLARVAAMSRAVRSRRSVERERQHLEGILNSVGEGVYGVDNSGRLSFVNPAARRILGYGPHDRLVGFDARSLFHDRTETGESNTAETCFLTHAYTTGERIVDWQSTFRTAAGDLLPVEGTVYPLVVGGERQGSVVAFRDVAERKRLEEHLRWQATHDPLTQLLNRRSFDEELAKETQRLARTGQISGLIHIDLDQFKYINDTAGHAAGDRLLVEIAERLRQRQRESDTLARLGGDEFAVLLHGIEPADLEQISEDYRQVLNAKPFVHGERTYTVTASVGASTIDRRTESAEDAIAAADGAAQTAKEQGRNRVQVSRGDAEAGEQRASGHGWATRLQNALGSNQFALALQPVVPLVGNPASLQGGAAAGPPSGHYLRELWETHGGVHLEALLRLSDGDGGWIRPAAFLPAAHRFQLSPAIDRWVLGQVIALVADNRWLTENGRSAVAVNLAAETVADPAFAGWLEERLTAGGVGGDWLQLEVAETTALGWSDAVAASMAQLDRFGVGFTLDQFGSGFSALTQINNLGIDALKVDARLTHGQLDQPATRETITAISRIAHSAGVNVIAAAIEDRALLTHLRTCGVDAAQGNCLVPPRFASTILAELRHE